MTGDQDYVYGSPQNYALPFAGRKDDRGYILTDDALLANVRTVGKILECLTTICHRLDQIEARLAKLEGKR
ncbi:MAG: hypothetical protein ACR2QF_03090 [Geminicoccaceae bacterium]